MKGCFLNQEKDARDIEIPNIRWDVFELMMRLENHWSPFLLTHSLLFC
jgi:hypothetical protein